MSALPAFIACPRLRQVEIDWFRRRDVSAFVLAGYRVDPSLIGIAEYRRVWAGRAPPCCPAFSVRRARVVFLRGGTFAFEGERRVESAEVEPAIVLPAIESGAVVDVVAWHPRSGRLACLHRFGWSGLLVGPDGLDGDDVLDVHPDPLSWLQAGRRGVVVVREPLARPVLLDRPAIRAMDIAQGNKLKAMLERVRLPRIVVPASSIGSVAA